MDAAQPVSTHGTAMPTDADDATSETLPVLRWRLDDAASSSAVPRGAPLVACGRRRVAAVAAGGPRDVVLTEDGTALESSSGIDRAFRAVCERLTQVSCGESHVVALNRDGQPVTWGASDPPRTTAEFQPAPRPGRNRSGRRNRHKLATAPTEAQSAAADRPVPFAMDPLRRVRLQQVSCGDHHTIALSSAGEVFAWGTNDRGQLGLGPGAAPSERDPRAVRALCGIPVRGLAAGAAHSVAVTLTGGVFAWGANSHGQLCHDRLQDAATPERLETLRGRRVAHAACGARHTALLTEDGTLLVTGGVATTSADTPLAAASGEAPGHGCVVAPRDIGRISQIACSRSHTAALSADSGRVYLLLATNPPGGTGGTPATEELRLDGVSPGDPSGTGPFVVKNIFAGGNRIYATCRGAEEPPVDPDGSQAPRIFTVTAELSAELASKSRLSAELEGQLEVIFSSAACLNGSFLLSQRPSSLPPELSLGLDVGEARRILENLDRRLLSKKVMPLLRGALVPSLERMRDDEDSLRVLALLLLLPATPDLPGLAAPAVARVARLPDRLRRVFEHWLAHLAKADFLHVLKACTGVLHEHVTVAVTETRRRDGDKREMPEGLAAILKKLHEIGTTSAEVAAAVTTTEEDFHDPRLSELIGEMHQTLLHRRNLHGTQYHLQRHLDVLKTFTTFPFLLDSEAKISLFELTAAHLLQKYSNLHNLHFQTYGLEPTEHPTLPLMIRRGNLLEDTIALLSIPLGNTIWIRLEVSFVGEAVAGPGVNAEFFDLFMRELLLNEAIGIRRDRESNLLWFSEDDAQEVLIGQTRLPCSYVHRVIGLVCGLAVYNRVLTDFRFPLALYKKLLGFAPDLGDLRELSPRVARSMDALLADADENLQDTLGRTFTCPYEAGGGVLVRELIPGGGGVMVTQQNKHQYAERFVRHTFGSEAVQRKYERFASGFAAVCKELGCRLLSPRELRDVACGTESYDWPALEKGVIYDRGFSSRHETIRMFWEVFRELTHEQKKRFLTFVTGSERVPPSGTKALGIRFCKCGGAGELPRADACLRTLYLPPCGEKTAFRDKVERSCTPATSRR